MEIGLVLTLCGLGIAFWIPAFILGMISGNKMRKCTADATATVVRINVRNSGDNGLSYHPIYEYYAGLYIRRHLYKQTCAASWCKSPD